MRDLIKLLIEDIEQEMASDKAQLDTGLSENGPEETPVKIVRNIAAENPREIPGILNASYQYDSGESPLLRSQEMIKKMESRIRKKLRESQAKKKYRSKYEYFYFLLEKHSSRRKHMNIIARRRLAIFILLIAGE